MHMKIFLSHSSTDKAIVKRIYDELGAALCHYDQATFNPTGNIALEVYKALNESTHFVFFASPTALSSDWVEAELARAFDNWMRNGRRSAMVFLLDGTEFSAVPEWLQIYVMREPPTYRHILLRIQSEIDKEKREEHLPPFVRNQEIQKLETNLIVETSVMPGGIFIYGPDGSGRKSVINELYRRNFPAVCSRKLLLKISAYTTEIELFRDLKGLTTIASPREFSRIFHEFESLNRQQKLAQIATLIYECTQGNQCLILEADASLQSEDGKIPDWLTNIIVSMAGKSYPRLAITAFRKPTDIPLSAFDKILVQEAHDIDLSQSKIIFNWWLRKLDSAYDESLKDLVLDACSGNPKQLELGAKLLTQEGRGNTAKIRPQLIRTLEGLSKQFIEELSKDDLIATTLAFVANAGYVTRSDLTQYLTDTMISNVKSANEAISICCSYGFLVEDEVCIRIPDYLVRGARAIGKSNKISINLSKIWELQAKHASSMKMDEVTSIAVLNEYCLTSLRAGNNDGTIFDSIILPSQCLHVAKTMYDRKKYKETLNLCNRAYLSRGALSLDGLIETLRYAGMASARIGDKAAFKETISRFSEVSPSNKAKRISCFITAFYERLEGNYDKAFSELLKAHGLRGETDLHILRELAFICLNLGDIAKARGYINQAMARAASSHYVLELAVRAELSSDAVTVAKRSHIIESLLEKIQAFDTTKGKTYWITASCEYYLALNDTQKAEDMIDKLHGNFENNTAIELIKAKILFKKKQYSQSIAAFRKLFEKTVAQKTGQRKSILPIICRELIDSSAAFSTHDGIEAFKKCERYMPSKLRSKSAKELLESLAFTQDTISQESKRLLDKAANQ